MSPSRTKAVEFIDKASTILGVSVNAIASALALYMINFFTGRLTVKDGDIQNIEANYDVINKIDEARAGFFAETVVLALADIASSFFEIEKINEQYFTSFDELTIDKVSEKVFAQMHKAFGFEINDEAVTIQPGGWLADVGDFKDAYSRIREDAIRAVAQEMPLKEFNNRLKVSIAGADNIPGLIKSHFRTIVHDVYAEYDRQVAFNYADALGYRAAIYEGGLIDHSRDFCIERDGHVFTFDEIKAFGTAADKYGGYTDKSIGKFEGKPSVGYDPFFDQGGHNCRHAYSYIPDKLAIRLRPELKEQFTTPQPTAA